MNEKDGAGETYMHDGKLMIGRLQLMRNYKDVRVTFPSLFEYSVKSDQ